jgi:hypothetical protein
VATSGRADRSGRLLENRSGASGSSSADFMRLVRLLFAHSAEYAARIDGNCSPYALTAIPMLLSSLRCLVVEYASYPPRDSPMLDALTQANDFGKMLERYRIDDPLRSESLLLQELRNEIIHPAHRPSGTPGQLAGVFEGVERQRRASKHGPKRFGLYIFLSVAVSSSLRLVMASHSRHRREDSSE